MRDILPLSTLPVFEAAARHQSFALAAAEINLSQAAVSRQIKQLEERLGVLLFERGHRSVRLTEKGERLQRATTVSLDLLRETARTLKPDTPAGSLNVATDLALAHFWLVPRLDDFQKMNTGLSIYLMTSDDEQECLREDIDVAILYGDGSWPGHVSRFLIDEEIFPVCSRDYFDGRAMPTEPIDLLREPLLDVVGGPWSWITWPQWMAEHGVEFPPGTPSLEFNTLPWAIQAACAGQGVTLGWKHLCDDLLASGTLIRPITHSVTTGRGYYVVIKETSSVRDEIEKLLFWLDQQKSGLVS
ncbi:MAG: LysR family transcriptional regulator [Rhodospirillaceae bacterium]|jgi:LysR family transcriptional regulator, glycine cleavage system transcriptional activator|nr:LysR family transcriptional regulator [Rhodospirillaceae bacterium]MBT7648938.1 LysR family transcriptional regulator [Rhodospirillaceae bacterium]